MDPSGQASFEVQDINSLSEEIRNYDPTTGRTYVEGFDRAGNDTRHYKAASPTLHILAQSGGKQGALETLAALRAVKFKHYAVTITEESDYTNGVLNAGSVYRQFLARVGGFAADVVGIQAAFEASIAGAGLGESRDISLPYNVGYDYSSGSWDGQPDQGDRSVG